MINETGVLRTSDRGRTRKYLFTKKKLQASQAEVWSLIVR